jgi:hypothetical protein
MKEKMIKNSFPLQIIILFFITFLLAIYPISHYFTEEVLISTIFGSLISIVSVFIGYGLIVYSTDKPNKVFFKAIFGGMIVRMVFIGVAILCLIKIFNMNMYGLIASLFFYYFLFLTLEILFLNRKFLNKNTK